MSACGVGLKSSCVSGTKSSGDINRIVPPAVPALHELSWSGSVTAVIKMKPARQGRGGSSLDMRIFDYYTSKRVNRWWGNAHPFEVPVCDITLMEVLQTLGCAVQLLLGLSKGSGGESGLTYQLQPVGGMNFNVFHDATVLHPL